MSNPSSRDEEILKAVTGFTVAAISISFLPVALYWWIRWRNPRREKFNPRAHFLIPVVGCVFTALLWISFIDPFPLYEIDLLATNKTLLICLRIASLWIGLLFISSSLTPLALSFRSKEKGLRTQDFIDVRKSSASLAEVFCRQDLVPIGHDVKTEDVVSLPQKKRSSHVLVIGATGTGKTNLMTNLILHAIRHRQPCVVIDPKGESSSLELIREYGNRLSDDFETRLQVFSMSSPGTSANYNPLKHGNANQLKDRMMEAFVWSEPYYQNVSASFLTAFTACTEFLGISLNLERVSKILLAKEERAAILKQLQEKFNSGDQHALELFHLISPFFSKAKEEELSGLGAQISILNNPTFGHLLSFEKAAKEIDLRHIRKTGGIAYFQLDTLGNGDSARRLGRMIIEDLKSMSSEVYKSEPNENDRIFFPIFIDEFGSFASREFIEFLKQSRGAKFGIHAFCQGLEDMDAVTSEFRRQVISNTMTKIGLRMDDHETVDAFCATAGTFDTLKQSYQVSGELIANRTGMGNMREAKQMQIEHDVLKQLKIGQAVVIEKSPSRVRGLQIPLFEDIFKSL
ncbi:MAG: type IV secretion system DNA-binding domain-containing protein [Bdellovibrionales bacterium]|nr:type IV secretion system DNA-binding domain-containing protein [Bdellovibrionales bacterium]